MAIIFAVVLAFVYLVRIAPSYASASDFLQGYNLLDEYRGTSVTGVNPIPLNNVNITSVTDYYQDSTATFPNYLRVASTSATYQQYVDEGLQMYVFWASEATAEQFLFARQTSSGSGSGGYNRSSCTTSKEVQTNIFICHLDTLSSASLIYGGTTPTVVSTWFGVQGLNPCNTNCSKPIGVAFSTADVSTIITGLSSYGDAYDLMLGLISASDPTVDIEVGESLTGTYDTRFTDLNVTGASSSTVTAKVDYFIDTDELTAGNRPDAVLFKIVNSDLDFQHTQYEIIIPLSQGSASTTVVFNENFPDGEYQIFANFWNINNNSFTFDQTSITGTFAIVGGVVVLYSNENVYNNVDGTNTPDALACGISSATNIANCAQNVLVKVFVPTSASLLPMYQWQDNLINTYPFNIAADILTTGSTFEATTTSLGTSTLDLPYMGEFEIFSEATVDKFIPDNIRILFKSIMGWALWLGFFSMIFFTVGSAFKRTNERTTKM